MEHDYLDLARKYAELLCGQYDDGKIALASIACSLIALIERLDRTTDHDYQDSGQAVLMIGSPFKL